LLALAPLQSGGRLNSGERLLAADIERELQAFMA